MGPLLDLGQNPTIGDKDHGEEISNNDSAINGTRRSWSSLANTKSSFNLNELEVSSYISNSNQEVDLSKDTCALSEEKAALPTVNRNTSNRIDAMETHIISSSHTVHDEGINDLSKKQEDELQTVKEGGINSLLSWTSLTADTKVDKLDEELGQKANFASYRKEKKKRANFAYGTVIIGLVFKENQQAQSEIMIASDSQITIPTKHGTYYESSHKIHSIRGMRGIYVANTGNVWDSERIRKKLEGEVNKRQDLIDFDWVVNKTKELLDKSVKPRKCGFTFASVLNRKARLAKLARPADTRDFVINEYTCVAHGSGATFALADFVNYAGCLGMLNKKGT